MQENSPQTDDLIKENYHLIEHWAISKKIVLIWNGLSIVLAFFSLFFFVGIYLIFVGRESFDFDLKTWQAKGFLLFLVLFTIVIHELIHGAVMAIYKGKPKYGVGLAFRIMPYASATSDAFFSRRQFSQICMAPLIVISVVGAFFMVYFQYPVLLIPLVINASGAIGDIWFCMIVLRQPNNVLILDQKTGFRIYGPKQ